MADVVRVDTNYMAGFATKQEYQRHGYGQRVMEGALRYQYNMNVPFMLVSSDKNSDEILKKMGFHYIYDRFHYFLLRKYLGLQDQEFHCKLHLGKYE